MPAELTPEQSVVTISEVATEYGVSESAIEDKEFPDHQRVGRTLVAPSVLEELAEEIEAGMSFEAADERLAAAGIEDASAALNALGYRVEWEGLGGGTVREK